MISEGSCDTEDMAAEMTALEISYILKYITIENSYFKSYFVIIFHNINVFIVFLII